MPAHAQNGGGDGGLGNTGLGDARAHNLPTSQGINNGYENGLYYGAPAGPAYGFNPPPPAYYRGGPAAGPAAALAGRARSASRHWRRRHASRR